MRAAVALVAAAGLVLFYWGLTGPVPDLRGRERRSRNLPDRRPWPLGVLGGAVVGALGLSVLGVAISVPVAAAAAWLPAVVAAGIRERRRRTLAESWPDALSTMIAEVRAGYSLPECCTSLAGRGPEALRPGFGKFAASYMASGNFAEGLRRLRDELEDPIADRVVAVLEMAHEVGGNDLVRVLQTTTDFVRDELRISNEVRARWSWTVNAARLAAAAPFLVLTLMLMRPEGIRAYSSPGGRNVIMVGALFTLLGYRLMRRAARLPQDLRLAP